MHGIFSGDGKERDYSPGPPPQEAGNLSPGRAQRAASLESAVAISRWRPPTSAPKYRIPRKRRRPGSAIAPDVIKGPAPNFPRAPC